MKIIFKCSILLSILTLFSGCAGLFTQRTFVDEMERNSEGFFVPGKDFSVTSGDSGEAYRSREEIQKRTPASIKQQENKYEANSLYKELHEKEMALSPMEYEEYMQNKDVFQNVSEQVYFLDLSVAERKTYLQDKGEGNKDSAEKFTQNFGFRNPAPGGNDIEVGMGKDQVIEILGRPYRVDVAGDVKYQNERWTFYDNGRLKSVYFESGKVNGWNFN
jgi:hypothetical protein